MTARLRTRAGLSVGAEVVDDLGQGPQPHTGGDGAAALGHAFTRGLERGREAVGAAFTLRYHNGGTEGVNTKFKVIARQMYGRAGFALLRHRILPG